MMLIGEKDNSTPWTFFFNLYELKVLNTYRMLLGLCIELRCIV